LVDGIAAPLYYVTPASISFVVPYEVTSFPVASIQVNNNGVLSNTVTTYVHQTTPGIFTVPSGGLGTAAMIDFPASGGYYIVSANQPANAGDTVSVFLTGLGTPFPPSSDGAPGGTSCVSGSCLVNSVAVDVGGVSVGTLAFAGEAPAEVSGLYQINFQVPPICVSSTSTLCLTTAGTYTLGITGQVSGTGTSTITDSYADQAVIPVSTGTSASAVSAAPITDASPAKTKPFGHAILPRLSGSTAR
jgi:uncharacterized protein (TIGR03437 family)